jgi:AraC-like DNA-binding protein
LSSFQAGDFLVEAVRYASDSASELWRNDRMIRAGDPDCYRMCLNITGGEGVEQAGNQAWFGPGDIGFFTLSSQYHTIRPVRPQEIRVAMVTFPRHLLPFGQAAISPLLGTLLPRRLPGRSLFAQFLIDLTGSADPVPDPCGVAEALRHTTIALLLERLGPGSGFTPATRCLLYQQWIRAVIARKSAEPDLNPADIACAVGISERYLHRLFRDSDQTPMQLVKASRLDHCYRDLLDPALAARSVSEIARARGYQRTDQFARDFRQRFAIPATQLRRTSTKPQQPTWRPA